MSLYLSFVPAPAAAVKKNRSRCYVGSRKIRMYSWRIRDELGLFAEYSHSVLGQPPVGENDLHALHDNRKFLFFVILSRTARELQNLSDSQERCSDWSLQLII